MMAKNRITSRVHYAKRNGQNRRYSLAIKRVGGKDERL